MHLFCCLSLFDSSWRSARKWLDTTDIMTADKKKRKTTPNKTAVLHCLLLGCDLDVNADEWASLQRIPPVYTACPLAWGKWGTNRQMPQASKCQLTVIHFSGASGAKVECGHLFNRLPFLTGHYEPWCSGVQTKTQGSEPLMEAAG